MRSSEKPARRKFTPEFKGQAVKRVLLGQQFAAKELRIGESLRHTWVTRHRLRRRLAQKEDATAILKKAMA